jgi:hypothetical protein
MSATDGRLLEPGVTTRRPGPPTQGEVGDDSVVVRGPPGNWRRRPIGNFPTKRLARRNILLPLWLAQGPIRITFGRGESAGLLRLSGGCSRRRRDSDALEQRPPQPRPDPHVPTTRLVPWTRCAFRHTHPVPHRPRFIRSDDLVRPKARFRRPREPGRFRLCPGETATVLGARAIGPIPGGGDRCERRTATIHDRVDPLPQAPARPADFRSSGAGSPCRSPPRCRRSSPCSGWSRF